MEKIKSLLSRSFGDSKAYLDSLEEIGFLKSQEAFCLQGDKGPVSVLFIKKYPLNVGSKQLTADYIFYAATDEEHRREGLMSTLIKETLASSARERGDAAVLIPASHSLFDYYGKLGFKTAFYYENKVFSCERSNTEIYIPSVSEAEKLYPWYYDFYGKRENTLFKTEEIFCQSVKEHLYDTEVYSFFTDGENFAFASLGERIDLYEFTGHDFESFARSVSAKYGLPVSVRIPSGRNGTPLGMIFPYNEKNVPEPLFADNMLN